MTKLFCENLCMSFLRSFFIEYPLNLFTDKGQKSKCRNFNPYIETYFNKEWQNLRTNQKKVLHSCQIGMWKKFSFYPIPFIYNPFRRKFRFLSSPGMTELFISRGKGRLLRSRPFHPITSLKPVIPIRLGEEESLKKV